MGKDVIFSVSYKDPVKDNLGDCSPSVIRSQSNSHFTNALFPSQLKFGGLFSFSSHFDLNVLIVAKFCTQLSWYAKNGSPLIVTSRIAAAWVFHRIWHYCDVIRGTMVVSNQQPHRCLLNRLCRSKKTPKLRVTGLFGGELTDNRWIPRTNGE